MNWISESFKRSKNLRNHYKMHQIDIYIKDPLPNEVNPDLVFKTITKIIPSHLFSGVDIVYVGHFDVFGEKQVNAVFQDGAIYVTNNQTSDEDMIDDIVHELAHSVEEKYRNIIYDDNTLKREFLGKRRRLYSLLKSYDYDPPKELNSNYHYDIELDSYLYKKVGYEVLWNMVSGLFPSPYSTTSLREYFAIGFEQFFMGDKRSLKENSPALYAKLEILEYLEEK